jgi:hypothetical protein
MKLTVPTIGVLTGIIVLASIGGIYAISYDSGFNLLDSGKNFVSGPMLLGNVKVTHLDENGDVLGYRQGENHITRWGMDVIMGQIFSGVNGSGTYQTSGNITGRVSHMQIGYGGEPGWANELAWNNTDILEPIGQLTGPTACARIATSSIDNTTAGQGPSHASPSHCLDDVNFGKSDCAAQINFTAIASFPGNICGGGPGTIDEAGIYTGDDPQGNMMFARNQFGSVTLGTMDTLQLEWEFTFKDDIT